MGSEPFWPRWVTGTGTAPAAMAVYAESFYRYMVFDPSAAFKVTDYEGQADFKVDGGTDKP